MSIAELQALGDLILEELEQATEPEERDYWLGQLYSLEATIDARS